MWEKIHKLELAKERQLVGKRTKESKSDDGEGKKKDKLEDVKIKLDEEGFKKEEADDDDDDEDLDGLDDFRRKAASAR